MTGEQFLSLLERQQMVPPHLIEKIRDQISSSKWTVTAAAVAKLLVDANHLTAFQARQLIGGAGISPKPAEDAVEEVTLDCAAEDFQLKPLEDEDSATIDTPADASARAISTPPMLPVGLAPLESPLEDLLGESSNLESSAPLVNMGNRALLSKRAIVALTLGMLTLMTLIYFLLRESGS